MRSHTNDLLFRKSSYSQPTSGNCVEVADLLDGAAVRDTQSRETGHLSYPSTEWVALLGAARKYPGERESPDR